MIRTASLILIYAIICSPTVFAQSGFKTIKKAELKYEKRKYVKALNLLNKADKMNYGFCSNAWVDANYAINILRYKIYTDLENYQMARHSLDSISSSNQSIEIDLMKIRAYQLEYGSKKLAKSIDTSFNNVIIICENFTCYAKIPIFDNAFINLKLCVVLSLYVSRLINETQRLQLWIEAFKKSNIYHQLIYPTFI